MAQANLALARTNAREINGLARWIACSAYQRFLRAETFLQRLVPVLIITFVGVLAIGMLARVYTDRHALQARQQAENCR